MRPNLQSGSVRDNQSAFSLTAIQVTGATSLPALNSSIHLFHQYGFSTSLIILLSGSIVIWLFAFLIISMTANTTKNTLDNVKDYLGLSGSITCGIFLLGSAAAYFITQINWTAQSILAIFPFHEGFQINQFFQYSGIIGIISSVLIIQGIKGLRGLTIICFPIILLAFLGILFFLPKTQLVTISIPTSFAGLALALGASLSVAVDYPTFFQHSRSKKDSIFAISAIQFVTTLIAIGGLYLGKYVGPTADLSGWNIIIDGSVLVKGLFTLLILLSCFCVNSLNIYSASIAWELIAPRAWIGRKEYAIIGISLTAISVVVMGIFSMELARILFDVPLAYLCLILAGSYLTKLATGNFTKGEKLVCYFGWIIGSLIATLSIVTVGINLNLFLIGLIVSVFALLVVSITKGIRKASQPKS